MVEAGDVAVLDPDRQHAVDFPVDADEQPRVAVDLYRLDRAGAIAPVSAIGQQASHLAGPHDGPQKGVFDSAAVAQGDDVRGEDIEQALQVAGFDRALEGLHGRLTPQLAQLAAMHSYATVFWWCAGIFAAGAVICGGLLRRGPLARPGSSPAPVLSEQATVPAER